jgi:hypothetical protein
MQNRTSKLRTHGVDERPAPPLHSSGTPAIRGSIAPFLVAAGLLLAALTGCKPSSNSPGKQPATNAVTNAASAGPRVGFRTNLPAVARLLAKQMPFLRLCALPESPMRRRPRLAPTESPMRHPPCKAPIPWRELRTHFANCRPSGRFTRQSSLSSASRRWDSGCSNQRANRRRGACLRRRPPARPRYGKPPSIAAMCCGSAPRRGRFGNSTLGAAASHWIANRPVCPASRCRPVWWQGIGPRSGGAS